MSIAANIESVTAVPAGYRLELTGRLYDQGDGSLVTAPPGQPYLTILDPTWRPEVGMEIWGDSDTVFIEAPPRQVYKREGYTCLREWTIHSRTTPATRELNAVANREMDDIKVQYLEAYETGTQPTLEALVRQHPEHRDEIVDFVTTHIEMENVFTRQESEPAPTTNERGERP